MSAPAAVAQGPATLDAPGAVGAFRAGEALDVQALEAWMVAHPDAVGPIVPGSVEVSQFPSGHSNLTYLVVYRVSLPGGEAGTRELVLRRPPHGTEVKSAHDMGREHALLSALHGRYPVPRPVALELDPGVLGAPFFLMERVRGVICRKTSPFGELSSEALSARWRGLSEALVGALVDLHGVPWRDTALAGLYRGEGYAQRQVEGWSKRWDAAKTGAVPTIEAIRAELLRLALPDRGATVIHNDLKYDNLVLAAGTAEGLADPGRPAFGTEAAAPQTSRDDEPARVVGVLDWEMATVGCPLMDLGTSLGYWVEATDPDPVRRFALGPTYEPGNFDRERLVERYALRRGLDLTSEAAVPYFAFGLFKLAVVAQQIYKRFAEGKTKDPRFGAFGFAVAALGDLGVRALERQRLSHLG